MVENFIKAVRGLACPDRLYEVVWHHTNFQFGKKLPFSTPGLVFELPYAGRQIPLRGIVEAIR